MVIKIFNTLGRTLEEFKPVERNVVKMYVCGPTVYDFIHIGHGRTFVVYDAISRYLRLRGYTVIRVQNITDIDDKIIKKSQETGKDWREIVDYYSKDYIDALGQLKIKIDIHPRVTQHIKEIIDFVQRLIDKGHAYVSNSGSVYFDVNSYPHYGELSGAKREEWNQEEEFIKEKKNPYDFALWKAWKPGEPYWDSPWGKGRPGWHIECSTMSTRYLGEKFDIHGGGSDLIFPHHENERAQTESLTGERWVSYWVHVAFLTIKKEKMSKSLGNIIPLNEALKKWGPSVLRYWYLSSHYRSPIDFSEEALNQASNSLQRIKDSIAVLRSIISEGPKFYAKDEDIKVQQDILKYLDMFHQSMSNDFDTATALSHIHEIVSLIFSKLQYSRDFLGAMLAFEALKQFNDVFGVMDEEFYPSYEKISKIIDSVIEIRNELRKMRMYEISDKIREELLKSGIRILDSKDKSTWRFE
ncbi:cysteine--tRNA ligase [Sulfolobus sp. A20]|uniref:cysteine--tRNA ligase n=1 Tax=Saccharolobus sp. A20 TaxID=1891280 RepID=UPI0008460D65|nr:cysteine--tRNA ligase [Sulfolobus sp. A20]TRM76676.1 cysteine--tRNA ligase [Sulfolobus sp. E5]TRM77912.1 cysteine--tRNA ligase [Sulfolobus sp. B5]TRM77952.1 cysteine--tRNA ligase [Sulfolobus sp. A20-N-F8]TRM85121.1 cysteine--tRNA ligase [Sulfolobus sp. F3]TRN02242.1 cysteine--tRNA ligase [Sulfolobus sp. F1]TRN04106.1 cysteine--tRNA ligase [Sulfolobus sp. E1]